MLGLPLLSVVLEALRRDDGRLTGIAHDCESRREEFGVGGLGLVWIIMLLLGLVGTSATRRGVD